MTAVPVSGSAQPPAPIDCETAVRRLWDYLDNRLPEWSHAEVEAHLATCLACPPHFVFAQTMRTALAASSHEQEAERGDDADRRLRERIRRALRADGDRDDDDSVDASTGSG